MLYIIPTPIGNLKDITLRALELLKQVDVILAEDTRTTQKLLNHYEIQKPLYAYHMHNEHAQVNNLIEQMQGGRIFGMVSDAGTPGISDAAFLLVRACVQHNIKVETLPGATAFVPALVNSGIPTNRFCFEGFLPQKKGRKTLFEKLAVEERTIIFYESPMRLIKTLQDCATYFGTERLCSVSRELSKMFEENFHGTLAEAITHFSNKTVKGEIVVVIAGLA
jgi:16S rRNA (cytidine1402-2'-O)-methyltransferase